MWVLGLYKLSWPANGSFKYVDMFVFFVCLFVCLFFLFFWWGGGGEAGT